VLGKVELQFDVDQPDPSATFAEDEVQRIDPEAFFALADLAQPSTAMGLLRFLEEAASDRGWVELEAKRLYPEDAARAERFVNKVARAYNAHAVRAKKALPQILGEDAGDDVAAWQALYAKRADDLPVQLFPQGWFPAT
jgi:hypothetical protein